MENCPVRNHWFLVPGSQRMYYFTQFIRNIFYRKSSAFHLTYINCFVSNLVIYILSALSPIHILLQQHIYCNCSTYIVIAVPILLLQYIYCYCSTYIVTTIHTLLLQTNNQNRHIIVQESKFYCLTHRGFPSPFPENPQDNHCFA